MKKVVLYVLVAFFAFSISGATAYFYNREDDLSLRYVLWQYGLHPYQEKLIDRALRADVDRDRWSKGKLSKRSNEYFPTLSAKR